MAEIKPITLEDLERFVDEYVVAKIRVGMAQILLETTKEQILKAFNQGGMSAFFDSKGRVTTVDNGHISVEKAAVVIDLNKQTN